MNVTGRKEMLKMKSRRQKIESENEEDNLFEIGEINIDFGAEIDILFDGDF